MLRVAKVSFIECICVLLSFTALRSKAKKCHMLPLIEHLRWNIPLIREITFVENNLTLFLLTHNY